MGTRIIGISGNARSGKDSLAICIQKDLQKDGLTSRIISLAAPLKEVVKPFVYENFGIDLDNCTDNEKLLLRPLMVAFGQAKRNFTQGRYFIDILDEKIRNSNYDFIIVPDIRFADFGFDELDWLMQKSGVLWYVEKTLENGEILGPPNEDEARNNPILKSNAHFKLVWPDKLSEEERFNFYIYGKAK